MTDASPLARIGQILVPVADVDRAAEFYEQVLGLPVLMRFPGIAFFDAAGIRLYLANVPQAEFRGRVTIYFWVDDVSGTLELLEGRGAQLRERAHVTHRDAAYDLWMAFVADLDGNNIGIMREAPTGTERG